MDIAATPLIEAVPRFRLRDHFWRPMQKSKQEKETLPNRKRLKMGHWKLTSYISSKMEDIQLETKGTLMASAVDAMMVVMVFGGVISVS
jgi:hypothetical protein